MGCSHSPLWDARQAGELGSLGERVGAQRL